MERLFVILGAANAFVAVALGAFGAHALKARLPPDLLAIFDTGSRYHFFHALGLFAAAYVAGTRPGRASHAGGIALQVGILLFSGSLYLLAVTGVRWLGAITPLGGVSFLVGWALLGIAAVAPRRGAGQS